MDSFQIRRSRNVRRGGRMLVRMGGAMMAAGSVLPWAYLPIGGQRMPWSGLFGWGAVTLVAGAALVWRPVWWLAAPVAAFAGNVTWRAWLDLPMLVKKAIIALQMRVEPMNGLLTRFTLPPLVLFDVATPMAAIRGPGMAVVLAGCGISLAGILLEVGGGAAAWNARRCKGCGYRSPAARMAAFCVQCGTAMPGRRVCSECHSEAAARDSFCAACGNHLPSE